MNKKGFTLVELMVVIVIIGILAAVAIPRMTAATHRARANEGSTVLASIANMQHVHQVNYGEFVTTVPAVTAAGPATGGWASLGFTSLPFSPIFNFTIAPENGFTALATMRTAGTLGSGVTGIALIGINAFDERWGTGGLAGLRLEGQPVANAGLLSNWANVENPRTSAP